MVTVLIIIAIQLVYVSFFTMRMIFTMKGKRYLAASLSTFEVGIYVMGLTLVLDNLHQVQNLIAYCVGYGLGVLTGSKIEEKLALGYIVVMVITERFTAEHVNHMPQKIREHGYGVTSWLADGRDGERLVMQILTRRKRQNELYQLVREFDNKAFLISQEPNRFYGGFWVKSSY